jgi:hypothetical protein
LLHLERTEDDIVRGENFSAALRTPPFTYRTVPNLAPFVSFKRVYGVSTQVDVHVFDSGATARFASPVPFRGGYTLMRFGGAPFQGLPRRSAIAELVQKNAIWREDAIQISTNAWEYHYAFQLHIPSLQQATHALAAEATTRYQLSDKGQLAAGIQRNIDLAVLRLPRLFNVVRQLTTPRTERLSPKRRSSSTVTPRSTKSLRSSNPWPRSTEHAASGRWPPRTASEEGQHQKTSPRWNSCVTSDGRNVGSGSSAPTAEWTRSFHSTMSCHVLLRPAEDAVPGRTTRAEILKSRSSTG